MKESKKKCVRETIPGRWSNYDKNGKKVVMSRYSKLVKSLLPS